MLLTVEFRSPTVPVPDNDRAKVTPRRQDVYPLLPLLSTPGKKVVLHPKLSLIGPGDTSSVSPERAPLRRAMITSSQAGRQAEARELTDYFRVVSKRETNSRLNKCKKG